MNVLNKLKRKLWRVVFKNARLSYSQSGEDMILDTILGGIKKGFYIDIGANNPYVQSNTNYFYKKGWKGVNIDALPGSMKIFDKVRPKDINIEAAISNDKSELTYYMFSSSFYNSFSKKDIKKNSAHTRLIGKRKILTQTLSEILDSIELDEIDFMSVDVEGLDLNVLESNNWKKYRPKVILTEYYAKDIDCILKDDINQFLIDKGYRFFCNTPTNAFYIENIYFLQRFGK
jgi:FkbM family methyltransferase